VTKLGHYRFSGEKAVAPSLILRKFCTTLLSVLIASAIFQNTLVFIRVLEADVASDQVPNWLSGWQYRKSHVIQTATGAGTDYQFRIFVNYNDSLAQASNVSTLNPDGCWCWFQDPRAVYHDGKTFFTWTRSNGDIGISCYNHNTKSITDFTLRSSFDQDDHSCPSILIRSDGKIIAFYTPHSGNTMRWRISTNEGDISSWSSEHSFEGAKSSLCYSQPVCLSKENNTIYLFYRSLPSSGPGYWVYRKSADNGETFGPEIDLFRFTRWSPYTKVVSDGLNKIHFAFGDDYGSATPHRDIMYCYYQNGSFYRANGSLIKTESQLPISDKGAVDVVYDSSAPGNYDAWIWDIALSPTGNPHIVFTELVSTTDHRYHYARWTGSQWLQNEICRAGGYIDGSVEGYYSGGLCLDHNDPTTVYLSKQVSGEFEIYKYDTSDGGTNWTATAITSNSTARNCRPTFVVNSTTAFKIIWWHGSYNYYTDYHTSLLGYSVEVKSPSDIVSCEGHCKSNFGDIRFTASDGTTLLDYWLEDKTDGDYAAFWVKVSDNLSVSDATIYMYYGKNDASTTSNGYKTFVFFDDFSGTSLNSSLWVVRQGDISISNGELQLIGTSGTRGLTDASRSFGIDKALYTKVRWGSPNVGLNHFCSMRQSDDWNYRAGDAYGAGDHAFNYESTQAGVATSTTSIGTGTPTNYHVYMITWKPEQSTIYMDEMAMAQHTTNVPSTDQVVVFYEGTTVGGNVYVDWCFVRKWVDPEPGHGGWGTQETSIVLQMNPKDVICRKNHEQFAVNMNVFNACNVEGLEFEICYNTTLLDYANIEWNSWNSGTIAVDESQGIVMVSTTAALRNETQALVTIKFVSAYIHSWKCLPGWVNDVTGKIYLQWANLSYSDGPNLVHVRDELNLIDVGECVNYTFSPIQGDINNDGNVDIFDLRTFAMCYGVEEVDPLWAEASKYDLTSPTGEHVIDIYDLRVIASNYGFKYP
jgi:hypothetical protein